MFWFISTRQRPMVKPIHVFKDMPDFHLKIMVSDYQQMTQKMWILIIVRVVNQNLISVYFLHYITLTLVQNLIAGRWGDRCTLKFNRFYGVFLPLAATRNTPVIPRKYLASVCTTAISVRMRVAPYFHSYKLVHSSNPGITVIARCIESCVRVQIQGFH